MAHHRWTPLTLLTLLALGPLACVLPPKGIGGDEAEGTTGVETGDPSTGEFASSGGIVPDDSPEEIVLRTAGRFPFALATMPEGDMVGLFGSQGELSNVLIRFDADGEQWTYDLGPDEAHALTVTNTGTIMVGGADFDAGATEADLPTSTGMLWRFDGAGALLSSQVVGTDFSLVPAVATGGGVLWTTLEQRGQGGAPASELVLQRRALDGTEELAVPQDESGAGLEAGPDGSAYLVVRRGLSTPSELRRVTVDGSLQWTVGLESSVSFDSTVEWLGDGVPGVLVTQRHSGSTPGLWFHAFGDDGSLLGSFLAPDDGGDLRSAADDSVVTAIGGDDGSLLVERYDYDGTLLEAAWRSFGDADPVSVRCVEPRPGAVAVGGFSWTEEGGLDGFVRYVELP